MLESTRFCIVGLFPKVDIQHWEWQDPAIFDLPAIYQSQDSTNRGPKGKGKRKKNKRTEWSSVS